MKKAGENYAAARQAKAMDGEGAGPSRRIVKLLHEQGGEKVDEGAWSTPIDCCGSVELTKLHSSMIYLNKEYLFTSHKLLIKSYK